MAVTFQNLKDKLGDWISSDTNRLTDTVRGDLINMSRREIVRDNDLRFYEIAGTVTTALGVATVAVSAVAGGPASSTFSRPLKLWYIHPSNQGLVELEQISLEKYIERYTMPSVTTGLPAEFALWGGNLYFGPTPDRVLAINCDYYAIPADMAASGDNDDFSNFAWEAILYLALMKASKYLQEDDRVAVWADDYREQLSKLQREHQRARSAGRRSASTEPG